MEAGLRKAVIVDGSVSIFQVNQLYRSFQILANANEENELLTRPDVESVCWKFNIGAGVKINF